MTRQLMSLVVLAGALSFACHGDKPSPAGTPASGKGETGIAECDRYIRKYEACVRLKVPAVQRPQLEQGLEQYRQTWRTAAANPQSRSSLAMVCQQAETSAAAAMRAYGCEW